MNYIRPIFNHFNSINFLGQIFESFFLGTKLKYTGQLQNADIHKIGDLPEKIKKIFREYKLNSLSWFDIKSSGFFTNSLSFSPKLIGSKDLFDVDIDASSWAIRHEISHLMNSDSLKRYVPVALLCFAMESFLHPRISFWPTTIVTTLIGNYVFLPLITYFQERRADHFANRSSTPDELKGALRFLTAAHNWEKTVSKIEPAWKKPLTIKYARETPVTRINKVLAELKRRKVEDDLDHQVKDLRVQQLYRILFGLSPTSNQLSKKEEENSVKKLT